MNRLRSELQRLYFPRPEPSAADGMQAPALIDAAGRVRCLVMEVKRPPSWEQLSPVWQGVQGELELPAPAIAVSGTDGLQLWFSLAEPIAIAQAHAFLECLRLRYLPDVKPSRVRLMPAADASVLYQERHAPLVPALQEPTGNWSAFVAQDLAPIFSDEPWLDIEPNEEGQATLLRGLAVTQQTVFDAAWERLGLGMLPARTSAAVAAVETSVDGASRATSVPGAAEQDPKQFLLRIMNDDSVALALRIDAAKALLPYSHAPRP